MRRSLLNKPNLSKSLRKALVLITMLFLPNAAWGQITVAGNSPDANGNISGDGITVTNGGSVTFVSTGDNSGTLTLNNASITKGIESSLDNLTIKLVGNNTVNSAASNAESGDNYAIYSNNPNATLTIVRNEANANTNNTKLDLYARNYYSIIGGFASVSYGEGDYQTYLSSPHMPAGYGTLSGINQIIAYDTHGNYITNASITSDKTYQIWLANPTNDYNYTQITSAECGTEGGVFYYNEVDNTLQLNNYETPHNTQEYVYEGRPIVSNEETLNVKLKGENIIGTTATAFFSIFNNAQLKFTTDRGGSLSVIGNGTFCTNFQEPITCSNGLKYNETDKKIDVTSYELKINNNVVTSATANNVLNDTDSPTVTFDASSNILTLNGANIESIQTDINNLKIELIGENKINGGESSAISRISSSETLNLTIQPASSDPLGGLNLANSDTSNNPLVNGFNVTLGGTLFRTKDYSSPSIYQSYITSLMVGSLMVAKTGAVIEGQVGFTNDADNELTLNGAELTGDIISSLGDLTIKIAGANTLTSGHIISNNSNGILTIKKGTEDNTTSTLTISNTDEINSPEAVKGFKSVTLTDVYLKSNIPVNYGKASDGNNTYNAYRKCHGGEGPAISLTFTTSEGTQGIIYYPLWIGGEQVNSAVEGSYSFESPNTLKLSNYATCPYIISAMDNLTISLSGTENAINTNDSTSAIRSIITTAELTFVRGDENACKLLLNNGYQNNVISGFKNSTEPNKGSGIIWNSKSSQEAIVMSSPFEGEGTSESPYLISSFDDLMNLSTYVNNGTLTTEYFRLENNIVIEDPESASDFLPIGYSSHNFIGTFDGNNMTISGLRTGGLFGNVGKIGDDSSIEGTIMNLKLENCTFSSSNTIGGIASTLIAGTIQNCSIINTKITSNQQSPKAGGIVGEMYGGLIKGCTISGSGTEVIGLIDDTTGGSNGSATVGGIVAYASTSGNNIEITECEVSSVGNIISSHSVPNDWIIAGGIVGLVYGSSENSTSISKNTIKGSTIITSENNLSTSSTTTTAGAIIGSLRGDNVTLNNNTYESTVTTKIKDPGATDYTTNSGNTQRGIGDSDDIIENSGAMLAGTKSITIGCFVDYNDASSYYYSSFDEENEISTVLDLPENNTVICLSLSDLVEAEGSTAKFTITNASTNKEIDATIEDVKEDNVYSYTKISFTMPDADVTIAMDIFAIPVSLSELGFVDENQTSSTYFSTEKNWNVPEGIVAYVITGISGSNVITSRVSSIPKGVPVFLEKGSSTEEPKDNSNNILYGTVEATDVTSISGGTVYVLYNNMFVKSTSGTIPAHRCYLLIGNSVATTRGFGIDHGDGTSGISEVKSGEVKGEKRNGEWYTLQGRKFTTKPTKPGLYILNGKKVVIK